MSTSTQFDNLADSDLVDAVYATFVVPYDDANVLDMIAALRVLDQLSGVARDDDRVVICPGVGFYLLELGRVVEPEELAAITRMMLENREYEYSEEDERKIEGLVTDWFTVCFDLPSEHELPAYHPSLQGKSITMRFLTEEQAEQTDWMVATYRADGTLIELPGPASPRFDP